MIYKIQYARLPVDTALAGEFLVSRNQFILTKNTLNNKYLGGIQFKKQAWPSEIPLKLPENIYLNKRTLILVSYTCLFFTFITH